VVRLRHILCQDFPGRVSRVACRAIRVPPPSSNRTCGFPASGFRRVCRLWLHRQLRNHRPQGTPAQLLIVLVCADSRRPSIRSLATSPQVLPGTDMYVLVDPGKSFPVDFGFPDPSYRRRLIGLGLQRLLDLLQKPPQALARGLDPLDRLAVHTRCTPILSYPVPSRL
jgi:hypothetical protein